MKEIKAKEGYYLTNKDKSFFILSISGMNITEEMFENIPIEEADKIIAEREAMEQINTLEDVDTFALVAEMIPAKINSIEMTNKEALDRKKLFPMWKEGIEVVKGEKYQSDDDDNLWECIKSHITQLNWKPSLETASLWKVVVVDHSGTIDDPIPFTPPMELFKDKYYIQSEIKYKCTRNSEIPLSQNLAELVNLYVEVVK